MLNSKGSFQTWACAVVTLGQLSHWGSCHPGAVVYLGSCPTWAIVLPGQLSTWAVVAWPVVCLGSCRLGSCPSTLVIPRTAIILGVSPSLGKRPLLRWSPSQLIKHELTNCCSGTVLVYLIPTQCF